MSSPSPCPRCGTPLGPDAPEGLCPRCLLEMNLAAQTKFTGEPSGAADAAPPPPPADMAAKFPQLEILECLGRGGMGVVYKARQPLLNRMVALKILAPEKEKDPQFAERFTREAQALARLNHPNIVTVFDFGETGGLYYLLMEYVDGVTLRQLLAAGRVAPEQALAIVPRICEALQFAHEQGIVHRDIKPENVLLDKQGRVKIADFGIAKLMGEQGGPGAFYTKGRMVVGTPYYMAPEQVENPLQVDHRADIYSLGVVFYEMLTGELPLGRFSLPSEKVQIDVRLDEVVLHALEKQPARRYQHASQVKTDLDSIASTGAKVAGGAAAAGAAAGSPFGAGNPFAANNPFGSKNPFGAKPAVGPADGAVPPKAGSGGTWKIVGIVAAVALIPLLALIISAVMLIGFLRVPPRVALQEVQQMQSASDMSKTAVERQASQYELRDAEEALAQAQKQADSGLITTGELQGAKDRVAIVKAQMGGDAVKIAQAQLTAAQNQQQFAEQQYQAGIADQTAEMAAKSKVEELQAVLAALEPSNNVASPIGSANLTMTAPVPPEAPAPATPPTPPASPAPLPAPDPKAAVAMLDGLSADMDALAKGLSELSIGIAGAQARLTELQSKMERWQALLKGSGAEMAADAVVEEMSRVRAAANAAASYASGGPTEPNLMRALAQEAGTLQQLFDGVAKALRDSGDRYEVDDAHLGVASFGIVNAQLSDISDAGTQANNANDPAAAMAAKNKIEEIRQSILDWGQLFAGRTVYYDTANFYVEDGNLACDLAVDGEIGTVNYLTGTMQQNAFIVEANLRHRLAHGGESGPPLAMREIFVIGMPLQVGFRLLKYPQSVWDSPGAAPQILTVAQTQIAWWGAQFKGTPAESIAEEVVQFSSDGVNAAQQGQNQEATALLEAFMNQFSNVKGIRPSPDGEITFDPTPLALAINACLSGGNGSAAVVAAQTLLINMRTGAILQLVENGGLDPAPALATLQQAQPLMATWQAGFAGAPGEKAAAAAVKMADDLHDALQQNQMEKAKGLATALEYQLEDFTMVLRDSETKPLTSPGAFAAALTQQLRVRLQGSPLNSLSSQSPDVSGALNFLNDFGTQLSYATGDATFQQMKAIQEALLQNQILQAATLVNSLSDNLGLAQSQLLGVAPTASGPSSSPNSAPGGAPVSP